ncbi:MAG: succinate dehydrogenase cytochrome b subunit [Planctomycetaceae bacterium]|nr:succinate dehydrogenase cytochrome b subunit [Planctomycetaceae bacterium]
MDVICKACCVPAKVLSKVPILGPLVRVYSTSVGQKILMAITGLALCGFLVAHLAGNLLLFAGEEAFNQYAEKLHSMGPLLAAAEIGLFATFALHMLLAVSTTAMSRQARKQEYAVSESKQGIFILPGGGASNWMLGTGIMILVFLILHIVDMKLDLRNFASGASKYAHVKAILHDNIVRVVYALGLIALGIHLSHGFKSALQSLGVNHKRWNVLFALLGIIFAWAVAGGFLAILAWGSAAPG